MIHMRIRHLIPRHVWPRGAVMIVVGLALLAAAGCLPVIAPPASPTPPLHKLAACTSAVDAANMNMQIALSEQFFAKYGLDVNIIPVNGGPNAATALLAGDAAICQIAGTAVVNAIAAGGDLVIVGGVVNRQPYYLIVHPDITKPADLMGKALGVSGPGSNTDLAARTALSYLGLKPDQDVAVLSVGGPSERLAALTSGKVAGTILSPPAAMSAMAEGYGLLLDLAELDKPYQHVAIITTRSFLREHPELVTGYLQASAEAIAKMQADKALTVAVMAKYLDLDLAQNAKALELTYDMMIRKMMNVEPTPSLPGIQALIDELAQSNPGVAALKPENVVDLRLVEQLTQEGFFSSLQTRTK